MAVANPVQPSRPLIEYGVATQALSGQPESGDMFTVKAVPDGVLVGVVDGLGHGPEAAIASRTAIATLEAHAGEPIESLIKRCHQDLLRTRGAVMSLASISAPNSTMTWLGVGNIDTVLLRADANRTPPRNWLPLRAGIVGYQLPTVRAATISVNQNDTLIFVTDGVSSDFSVDIPFEGSPQQIADFILSQFGRGTDDALVLAVRYRGSTV